VEKEAGAFCRVERWPSDIQAWGSHATRVDWNDAGLVHILKKLTSTGSWSRVIGEFRDAYLEFEPQAALWKQNKKMMKWVQALETWARDPAGGNAHSYAQAPTKCKYPPGDGGRCKETQITTRRNIIVFGKIIQFPIW
jgi:hypothetical protein